MTNELAIRILTGDVLGTKEQAHEAIKMAVKALSNTNGETIYRQAAIDAAVKESQIDGAYGYMDTKSIVDLLSGLPSAQPEITKEYNLKKIYNIYVKIAQAHFVYQPSKPKAITAMPFDWIETQNLLEKYMEDHGADFDALCREYVSENVKDDHLPSAQSEITHEAAVDYLQSTGWMQQHDREMYEMGLKARLADDSDSYDALAEYEV